MAKSSIPPHWVYLHFPGGVFINTLIHNRMDNEKWILTLRLIAVILIVIFIIVEFLHHDNTKGGLG